MQAAEIEAWAGPSQARAAAQSGGNFKLKRRAGQHRGQPARACGMEARKGRGPSKSGVWEDPYDLKRM